MKKKLAVLIFVGLMTGCATGTDGIVEIGPDMYMVGRFGKFTDYSGSAVKARLYEEAAKFCKDRNRIMVPINSTGHDSDFGIYASAEIQFKCVEAEGIKAGKANP